MVEMLQQLKRLTSKYQTPFGIAIWGFTAPGQAKEILVDSQGRLQTVGEFTGTVEVPNLDVALSTRASEATLSSILSKIDITLSNLRDAITAAAPNNKTLADLYERLNSIRGQLDATLSTRASETTVSGILSQLDITLSALRDALRGIGGKTLTDLDTDLANIYAKLDVALSTRASETTLSGIKTQTDKLTFDASSRLAIQNPPNLDVALSTRASESTLLAVKSKTDNLDVALSTRASESTLSGIKAQTDKLQFDASNNLKIVVQNFPTDYFKAGQSIGESPFNITKVAGTALTGRDWSGDFAKLQNLDTALSTRASESTLSGIKAQTDKLTFDTSNYLQVNVKATVNPSNLDVALSTRASESTLSGIKAGTDYLDDIYGRLDVALSTRASESTLSAIKNALASVGTDKMRVSVVDSLPAGTNKIGSVDVASIPNPSNLDVALSTRASESTLSSFVGTPDSSPPSKGVVLLGYDGTYTRRVKVASDGKLLCVLG
jgi:DNA-binding FrmR family transcriptional regulator